MRNGILQKAALVQAELMAYGASKIKSVADGFIRGQASASRDLDQFVRKVRDQEKRVRTTVEQLRHMGDDLLEEVGISPRSLRIQFLEARAKKVEGQLRGLREVVESRGLEEDLKKIDRLVAEAKALETDKT